METYHKIETLFKRDDKFKVDIARLGNPVIGTINKWVATEKIDGTNVRVCIDTENKITIGGRTDRAQMPTDLLGYLHEYFTVEKLAGLRIDDDPTQIVLYGEGYGNGIQKGSGYRNDKGFILFDVCINDKWWLDDNAVTSIASKLKIPRVPILGIMSLDEIVTIARNGFPSIAAEQNRQAEGIVARPIQPLFDHRHRRVIIKIKTKDFY